MNDTRSKQVQDASKVVYTTATGASPRGGLSLTKEATEPLPPPVKQIRKTTTKKVAPRVQAKIEPVHTHHRWPEGMWAEAQAAVRPGERLVIISATEARTVYVR